MTQLEFLYCEKAHNVQPHFNGIETLSENVVDRDTYTQWCKDSVFSSDIIAAAAILQRALNAHLINIYDRIGLAEYLRKATTAEQVVADLGYTESASRTIDAMLERLSTQFDFIEKSAVGDKAAYRQVNGMPDDTLDPSVFEKEIAEFGEDYLATLEFLQFGNEHFEYALKDDPEFLDRILSGREPEWEEMWFRATNVDPLQNVHGIMGAVAIDALFGDGDILEIGGGTGNGIRNLLAHLEQKNELHRVKRYLFTDISQKFIMSTRKEIRTNYPDLNTEWRFIDLNVPIQEQKVEKQSVDLIYAVNAAHVAKDIVAFLQSCHQTLRPGGRVLFAERVRLTPRDMAPRELSLNLSIYHRTAAIRNSDYRPMHCYLSPDNWIRVFELAGFKNAEIWPDFATLGEQFPDQYAAVVSAIRN